MEIKIDGVSKWYGNKPVLKDINLTIGKGITGLLGPNGAGKTTLLSIASGLLKPSRGRVLIGGIDSRKGSAKSMIGLLPENTKISSELTVLEFLQWQGVLSGHSHDIDRVLDITGMTKWKRKRIKHLSKGMHQRVKFAAALLGDPPILLLDEPFNGIDPTGRRKLRDFILSLKDEKTIVFSSHILEEVEMVASNIVILKSGFVLAEGSPEGIRKLLTDVPYKMRIESDSPRHLLSILFEEGMINMGRIENDNTVYCETFSFSTLAHEIPRVALKHRINIYRFVPEDIRLEKLFEYITQRGDLA